MTFGAPQSPSNIGENRRQASRMKAFAEVWADVGGTSLAIPCKVVDISQTGAKIVELQGAPPLPDDFVLHTSGTKYEARVVWREQRRVGVEFVTSSK